MDISKARLAQLLADKKDAEEQKRKVDLAKSQYG